MKLGIYLNSQHPEGDDPARRLAETIEQVRLIRSLGFDSIWAGEHHLTPGFHFYPQLSLLNRLVGEAEGMWVGTNLTLLPLHNPVEAAEIGAFLDVATGGKFLFGAGLGYRPEEFAAFGVPMAHRVSRFEEGIAIIRRLWTEDRVTHAGRHWRFSDATLRPRPRQAPHPPILIGAQVAASIKRAARLGDGWIAVPVPKLEELAAQAAIFTEARRAAGLAPAQQMCRLIEVGVAPDEETAFRRIAPYLMAKYASYASWGLAGVAVEAGVQPHDQLRRLAAERFAVGTPAQVTEMLLAQRRAGINHLAMRVSWPGMPQADILAGIELLGLAVLPEVRRAASSAG